MHLTHTLLLLVLAATFMAVASGGTCAPENYNKEFTIAQGQGSAVCHDEVGGDTPCHTTCLTCYTNCRGMGYVSTFIIDGLGSTTCLCSGVARGARISATAILFTIVMAAVNSKL